MRNTLREFLKLSRPLHSVSVVAKQAPLALSNAKVSCKHGLWLVARVNKKSAPSELYHPEGAIYPLYEVEKGSKISYFMQGRKIIAFRQ